MGDTIQFPKPEDRLRHSAEKAYQAKDYLKAYHDYQEIYTEHSSFEINQSLVKCLQQLADFAKALEVADDFLDEYLQDPNGFVQIGHLLILDGQYLQARKWIRLAEEFSVISEAASENLVKELDKVEEVQQILGLEDFLGKKQSLLAMDSSNQPVSGHTWHVFSQGLTKDQFVSLMTELLPQLTNPFLLPKLVEELVRLGSSQQFELIDYMGGQRQIIPNQLSLLREVPVFSQMRQAVNERIGQENPTLAEGILEELNDHFALSYPFLPETQEIDRWVQSYIDEYQDLFAKSEPQAIDEEIQRKKTRLRKILGSF